jgi:hypothetical protein
MSESTFYLIVYAWIALAILIFPVIIRVVVPYGRHINNKWGAMIDNRLGWIIMETPALLAFSGFFIFGTLKHNAVTWTFFFLFILHYLNRTLIFPFRLRTNGKKMPLAIVFMAIFFNLVNGFINGYYLGFLANQYSLQWFADPRFLIGITLFLVGMAINWHSDNLLIHLRKPGETGYIIPHGGFFELVSCPNHFGELIEWFGFALLTWSSPALAFAVWSLVNLMPRALHHHRWYQSIFPDYPKKRKAVIPYLL